METYKIQGVEIFSAGTWNGDEYTTEDLKGMVEAFEQHKEHVRPYLKLGHDDKQKLAQKDGLPAVGWIERVYMKGEKLVADFTDIPKKIFDLIQAKAYRKVSSEIYWNTKIKDAYHKHMLGAVALLGADTPGVMNLSDILAMYTQVTGDDKRSYEYAAFGGEKEKQMKTEQEIKLELDLEAKKQEAEQIKKDYAKAQEDAKAKDQELEQLRQYKAEADKKAIEAELEIQKAKTEKFCVELISEKLCTPAMKQYIVELLGADKKEYTFEDKKLSKEEMLKEVLKLFKAAAEVNFVENSSTGKDDSKTSDKEIDEKIKTYAAENKVTYGQAAKVILSQQK